MGNEVAPIVQFKRDVEMVVTRDLTMLDDRAKAKMMSAAVVAVTRDPELLQADRQSFMGALRMCAQHGVVPDGVEATLQVYNTEVRKGEWVKKVTYLPMIRGIINRVLRSSKVSLFYAEVVHEGEAFTLDTSRGDRRPSHALDHFSRKGPILGAYSVAKYADGTVDCEVVGMADLEKIRKVAKTQKVWDGWFAEKAKVAVMKRHAKRLPLSAEDLDFIINPGETDFDQRDVTPADTTQDRLLRVAQERRRASETQEPLLTGEVMDDAPAGPQFDATDIMEGSVEYVDGRKAAEAGMKESHNPFEANPEYSDWLAGYRSVRK